MAKTARDQAQARRDKIRRLRELGAVPYPHSFTKTHTVKQLICERDELEGAGRKVSCAGRVMRYNRKGKVCFLHIKDSSGRMQLAISSSRVGESAFELAKLIDLGDWVGARGNMITTKTGEYSLYVNNLAVLAKALRPLPIPKEKRRSDGKVEVFNAFKDEETRYRQRYIDLALNDPVREVFIRRSTIVTSVRGYLLDAGYLEVETPVLQPVYGGARARPFRTHHHSAGMDLFLRISNELYLKRCIIGGFEKVFEFSRDFRNEGMDRTHSPEFTLLEFYEAYADYYTMMDHVQRIIRGACRAVHGSEVFEYQGSSIDVSLPWPRRTLKEIIRDATQIDVDESPDRMGDALRAHGIAPDPGLDQGRMQIQLFEKLVAPKLIQPHIIMDFPKASTPLCKAHRETPGLIEQFEVYMAGLELVNAYTEQNDPIEQRILLETEAYPVDEDFLFALESGMPPTGGVGIGIDRLVMLLTNAPSLRDVLLFPLVKPVD